MAEQFSQVIGQGVQTPNLSAGTAIAALPNPEPPRNFLGSIVAGLVDDVVGSGRTAAALALSPFELLGANVPISLSDLSRRDLTGAAMLVSMGLATPIAGALRGTAALSAISNPVLRRATLTSLTEAGAGMAFGLLSGAINNEDPLQSGIENAALFGAFGGGLSLAGAGVSKTIGATLFGQKKIEALAASIEGFKVGVQEKMVKEVAGQVMYNPMTKATVTVARSINDPDKVQLFWADRSQVVVKRGEDAFERGIASLIDDGFTQNLGVARTPGANALDRIAPDLAEALQERGTTFSGFLEDTRVTEWDLVKKIANAQSDSDKFLAELVGDVAMKKVDDFGVPKLDRKSKSDILNQVVMDPAERAALLLDDTPLATAQVLRVAIRDGVLDTAKLFKGMEIERGVQQIAWASSFGGDNFGPVVVDRSLDLLTGMVMTPFRIAQRFPVIAPVVQNLDNALQQMTLRSTRREAQILTMQRQLKGWNRAKSDRVKQIIDESAEEARQELAGEAVHALDPSQRQTWITKAKEVSLRNAKATGDDEIFEATLMATDMMGEYLGELQAVGKLGDGLPGYFPIFNTSQWRLATGKEFRGFFPTKEAAEIEARKFSAMGLDVAITPNTWSLDAETLGLLNKKAARNIGEAMQGRNVRVSNAPGAGFLKERKLAMRDFEDIDLFDAMRIYSRSAERVINLTGFEGAARETIRQIAPDNSVLRNWTEAYVDRAMGRPTQTEQFIQAVANQFGVKDRVVARWAARVRGWESFSRLGGVSSGIVNLTQIAINTTPVLGPGWTTRAIKDVLPGTALSLGSSKGKGSQIGKLREVLETMKKHGADVDLFVPLSEAGSAITGIGVGANRNEITMRGLLAATGVKAKSREAAALAKNLMMHPFNSAEQFNRVVTWWGRYRKGIEALGETATVAAQRAKTLMERTQFNYRLSNTPRILSGPVGQTIGQFKSFFINELEFIASLNKKEAAGFAAMMTAMGGAATFLNIPGPDLLSMASGLFFDRETTVAGLEGANVELKERIKLADAEGIVGRFTTFGLPGFVNVDLSDYVGVGGFRDLLQGITGPAVADAEALWDFGREAIGDVGVAGRITEDTKMRLIRKVVPSQFRRLMQAQKITETGEVRDPYSHKLIYRPEDRLRSAIRAFVGPPEIELQQERIKNRVFNRTRGKYIEVRTQYARSAAEALIAGDRQQATHVLEEASGAGMHLTPRTLRYWVRELQRTGAERRFRRAPRDLRSREEIIEHFEINGVGPSNPLGQGGPGLP